MPTVKRPEDPHYKATLSVALHRARLQFHVAQDLFSSAFLDPGSAVLLRTLAGVDAARVLDLGCGYGPIGLFLKAWAPERTVHAVDRDELAVRYTALNAALNDLEGVTAYASLGYDDVDGGDFDLIVSNIPAKAGRGAIDSILVDGRHFLAPGGLMAVVVISRLAADVRATLADEGLDVVLDQENRGYACFHYRFPPGEVPPYLPAFASGVYDRGRLSYDDVEITTVHGLPEFDNPGFATRLAIKLLPALGDARHVMVCNPGQGLVPAMVAGSVGVSDRDLLAVRNAARNADLTAGEPDALVLLIRQQEPLAVTLAELARPGVSRIVVAGTSTQVTRVVEASGADVIARHKNHGFSAALMAR